LCQKSASNKNPKSSLTLKHPFIKKTRKRCGKKNLVSTKVMKRKASMSVCSGAPKTAKKHKK
jgi:hypothetical protein